MYFIKLSAGLVMDALDYLLCVKFLEFIATANRYIGSSNSFNSKYCHRPTYDDKYLFAKLRKHSFDFKHVMACLSAVRVPFYSDFA